MRNDDLANMYRANAYRKDIFRVLLLPGFFANHLFPFEKQHICTLVNDFNKIIIVLVQIPRTQFFFGDIQNKHRRQLVR